jgi:hypothetical protein
MNKHSSQKRVDALAQLKTAQKMLSEGQTELVHAQAKIERAQELIDHSADEVRKTWAARRP